MNNTDPKAIILALLNVTKDQYTSATVFFYDAPTIPNGLFSEFTNIPNLGVLGTQSYRSVVKALTINAFDQTRYVTHIHKEHIH